MSETTETVFGERASWAYAAMRGEPMEQRDEGERGGIGRTMVPVFLQQGNVVSDRYLLETKYLLRADEVADIQRISSTTVYEMCASQELETVKLRKSLRIKSRSVMKVLDRTE